MRWMRSMEKDVFPTVGKMLLPDVTAPLMLTVLRKVESRGARETASKLKEQSGQGSWLGKLKRKKDDKKATVRDTCFAILFLKRATRTLTPVISVDRRR